MSSESAMGHPVTLETLPEELFIVIAEDVQAHAEGLLNLSRTSRRLRSLTIPMLFSHCWLPCMPRTDAGFQLPPDVIRPHVRKLTCVGPFIYGPLEHSLRTSLGVLPNLRTVRFVELGEGLFEVGYGVPRGIIELCLSLPNVVAIDVDYRATWSAGAEPTYSPGDREDDEPAPNTLTHFSYRVDTCGGSLGAVRPGAAAGQLYYALAPRDLRRLVCGMHGTAEYLALPTECAPLAAMSALSWQRLRHLFLHGRYPIGVRDENGLEPTSVLRDLLRRTPGLRTLSIRNAQSLESFRAPILGPASVPPVHLAELRSLTVAYPDPEDSIFDINAPNLTYLSLRDEPRYYFTRRTHEPILRSSQCLRILRRMDSPLLESLEVVYEADGTDGDLLRHICTAYPRLARLELHRYRLDQYEDVAYITVAEHLGSIRTPQSARLNLDYPETAYGSTRDDPEQTANWLHVRDRRSKEVLTILEAACPKFECLGVLDPKEQCHAWVEYRPSWHP